jgi:hypothetical protein
MTFRKDWRNERNKIKGRIYIKNHLAEMRGGFVSWGIGRECEVGSRVYVSGIDTSHIRC